MADPAPPPDSPWLVRRWWVLPALLLIAALTAAALNREIPLSVDDAAPEARRVLEQSAHPVAATPWSSLQLTTRRTVTSPTYGAIETRVETTWTRLSPVLLRRHDDWYDVQGSRPLHEERTLTWLGLVGLRGVERERAPIFHDVLANHGWLGERTSGVSVTRLDGGFPATEGSVFEATTQRLRDGVPGTKHAQAVAVTRRMACRALAGRPGSDLHAGLPGSIVPVACESWSRQPGDSQEQSVSQYRLTYATTLGLYLPTERRDREATSPFDAADTVRWASTSIRYDALKLVP